MTGIEKTKRWLNVLDEAMDEQIANLDGEIFVHNPFTRKRIIEIWKMRKEAEAELMKVKSAQEA